jgi:FkbM family methyltransferase
MEANLGPIMTTLRSRLHRAFAKGRKGGALLTRLPFLRAALRHGIAASTEHLIPIRLAAPATLLDIGANKGQFSLAATALLPNLDIVAFEPLAEAALTYEALFKGNGRVKLVKAALSNKVGTAAFFVTDRTDSSSLLKPGKGQKSAFNVSAERTILVEVGPLSSFVSMESLRRPIMLKIDVQGAELEVLTGCSELALVDFVYVELSFVELYESQPKFEDVASFLNKQGFFLMGVFNQVTTPAFGPTQADFLFAKQVSLAKKKIA